MVGFAIADLSLETCPRPDHLNYPERLSRIGFRPFARKRKNYN